MYMYIAISPTRDYDAQINPPGNLFLTKKKLGNPDTSDWARAVFP